MQRESIKTSWKHLFFHPSARYSLLFMGFMTVLNLVVFALFLDWNELRPGYVINDFLLRSFTAQNVATPIFTLTYIAIVLGIGMQLKTPERLVTTFLAVMVILPLRCLTLYSFPLEAPEGIIPLRDSFLEDSFYSGKVLCKDLFFSGHTSNIFLGVFLAKEKWLKILLICLGTIVGILLLIQKVHFTIDVMAAPLASFFSVTCGKYLAASYFETLSPYASVASPVLSPVVMMEEKPIL